MIYCIDIDNTICQTTDMNYAGALPRHNVIDKINDLYDARQTIVLCTARHYRWIDLTLEQLEVWGVKYHTLDIGNKVAADVYIDDKALNINDWI